MLINIDHVCLCFLFFGMVPFGVVCSAFLSSRNLEYLFTPCSTFSSSPQVGQSGESKAVQARALRLSSFDVASICFAVNWHFGSSATATMSTGIMPAITFASSLHTVLTVHTVMAFSLCTDCILLLFFCSCSASAQICAVLSSDDLRNLTYMCACGCVWLAAMMSTKAENKC